MAKYKCGLNYEGKPEFGTGMIVNAASPEEAAQRYVTQLCEENGDENIDIEVWVDSQLFEVSHRVVRQCVAKAISV